VSRQAVAYGRRLLALAAALAAAPVPPSAAAQGHVEYAVVGPEGRIDLPADHGSHPDYRTEWWYVTGWLETAGGEALGFQVTFFRTRPDVPAGNPSAFAPTQLVIAHAALSDTRLGRLRHAERIARASHGLAGADVADTRVWLDDWQLEREGDSYRTRVDGEGFAFELALGATQPAMINGSGGYSRKGPRPESASFYYSVPQLGVTGTVERDGRREAVTGLAWLDHEWSTALLDERAVGWDWIGVNLDDGGALMAFRLRDAAGGEVWAGGSIREPDGRLRILAPNDVEFVPQRRWRSPRTGIEYPVSWNVHAGGQAWAIVPLLDDQESDARATTGSVYWEGAVRAIRDDSEEGRGYLELTGYGEPLRLPGD